MGPRAQRSRACNQCRERRVKCDETPPNCQQCQRLGLSCSGPIQGSVIIDMTDKVTKPRQRKRREKPKGLDREDRPIKKEPLANVDPNIEVSEPERKASASSSSSSLSSSEVALVPKQKAQESYKPQSEGDCLIALIRSQYRLPMLYQPSLADAFDHAFISHFVELNRSVRAYNQEMPWISHLPGLHWKASSSALKLSIRATSMAFYAKVQGNVPILTDSYKWYIMSLNSQRMALQKLYNKRVPNDEECLVPIILGLYEVYAGTAPISVFHHLTAATRILELRGPRACASGVLVPLFRALRVSDGHKAVVFNQPSVFAAPEWMTLPFVGHPKNAHQHLADILLLVPACIGLSGINCSLSEFFSRTIPLTTDLRQVFKRATELLHQLDDWAERFPHMCTTTPGSIITTEDMATTFGFDRAPKTQLPALVLPDTFVALTAATYKATDIILTLVLHKTTPKTAIASVLNPETTVLNPSGLDFIARATRHADDIISISNYLESTHPVGFDFLRSVFPLVVVAILGPSVQQQEIASQTLDRWGEKRGLSGLCGAWTHI